MKIFNIVSKQYYILIFEIDQRLNLRNSNKAFVFYKL